MAASGDVTVSGQGHTKLHPYLATLVRWCVSYIWSTVTVLLRRLMTPPYPQITAPKPELKPAPKPRTPGTDHLHPEPKVECVVLHEPSLHTLDVIFVHGLYGSLSNTWRQGDWKSKYKIDPNIVPLRKHETIKCKCRNDKISETSLNSECINDDYHYDNINKNTISKLNELNGILPNDDSLITEQFYNNTLLNNVENYETQAKFVEDMFRNECDKGIIKIKCNCNVQINECICKINKSAMKYNIDEVKSHVDDLKCNNDESKWNNDESKCNYDESKWNNDGSKCNDDECKINDKKMCDVGCGCICDECYSLCWPKDWIKMDFPGARVISINYTSDPYLWRPLWVKGNKRLRLHERADQMMRQLLELGVGEKPIIWVGHSKGGLFIKQIYCEAYEAYLKLNKNMHENSKSQSVNKIIQNVDINKDNNRISNGNDMILNNVHGNMNDDINDENKISKDVNEMSKKDANSIEAVFDNETNVKTEISNQSSNIYMKIINNTNEQMNDNCTNNSNNFSDKLIVEEQKSHINPVNESYIMNVNDNIIMINDDITKLNDEINKFNDNEHRAEYNEECNHFRVGNEKHSATNDLNEGDDGFLSNTEDKTDLLAEAGIWTNSVGFMFYSVPHRGSPLADIKTPITSRSVELLEISKDCALVLSLQDKWLVATRRSQPVVRSLVETCRTLMSVLWLRIVSVDSADAGIGTLSGVSVDHREICKPSSRHCLLYKELTDLIHAALNRCAGCH